MIINVLTKKKSCISLQQRHHRENISIDTSSTAYNVHQNKFRVTKLEDLKKRPLYAREK